MAIDLNKKAPKPTLTRYGEDKYAFTTGAYIQPISYIGRDGKRYFGWIVTGFEDDTYRDGSYLDVNACAETLQDLTPDDEMDENPTVTEKQNPILPKLRIRQNLTDYGTTNLEFDEKFATSSGYITSVSNEGFDYAHGEFGHFEDLDDDVLEDLACAVELQIEANNKTLKRAQKNMRLKRFKLLLSPVNIGDRFSSVYFYGNVLVRSVEDGYVVVDFEDPKERHRKKETWKLSDMEKEIKSGELKRLSCLYFRRKEVAAYSDWQVLPNFDDWDFITHFLPNYHGCPEVDYSYTLTRVILGEQTLQWLHNNYPEFKGYTLEKAKREIARIEKKLFAEAKKNYNKEVKSKDVIVHEFPIINPSVEPICHVFRRNKPDGSLTRSVGIWENMPDFRTWDFVEQFLPNYNSDSDVTFSNDVSCLLDNTWTREKFDADHNTYINHTLKGLRVEMKKKNKLLYERASKYFNKALTSGDIEIKEIPVGITSARLCVGENVFLWYDKNEKEEICVDQMKLQRIPSRVLDDECEVMQVLYTDEHGKQRWMFAQSIDFE